MILKSNPRPVFVILTGLMLFSISLAVSAGNAVPVTHLSEQSNIITANNLKPDSCSALTLTSILYCPPGGGSCNGTDESELVIGSPADDDIRSGKGDDCIIGGGGNDNNIKGEQGTDVCIGGPGTDTFHPTCEIQIQ